jgi:hypothetical protein
VSNSTAISAGDMVFAMLIISSVELIAPSVDGAM